jgi:serine/threonine-protein kinase
MSVRAATGVNRLPGIQLPDRYEVLHHIADGGMASVWCAEDRVLGRAVALKLLAQRYASDEEAVRRFEREGRAGARVSAHPHVVTIFDVGHAEGPGDGQTPYIVMEYLPGGTVAQWLAREERDPELALRWVGEAAAALDHAHALGVIHRDVKPGNLLLDDTDGTHVGDFGIARLASEATITTTGYVLGTAAYMAPEVARGKAASAAGDRYSLAVVAFELLAGSRPFAGDAWVRLAPGSVIRPERASRLNPALPASIDAVLERGMAPTPADRWPSATTFAAALEHAYRTRAATAPLLAVGASAASTRPTVPPTRVRYRTYRSGGASWVRRPYVAALAGLAATAFAAGVLAGGGPGASQKPAARAGRTSHLHAPKAAAAASSGDSAARHATATHSLQTHPLKAPPAPPGDTPATGPASPPPPGHAGRGHAWGRWKHGHGPPGPHGHGPGNPHGPAADGGDEGD